MSLPFLPPSSTLVPEKKIIIYEFFESVSTLRAAIELKGVFDQIQAAEKAGNLSPEEKRKLEEQAAEKGLQALFKVNVYTPPSPSPQKKINYKIQTFFFVGNKTRNRVCPTRSMRPRVDRFHHHT